MKQEKIQAYTRRITMANKTQMITILYEMVLDYIEEAEEEFESGNNNGFIESAGKAMNCIDELIHSLNLEYELGRNLLGLYLFEKRQLLRAVGKLNLENIPHVKKTFTNLHEAYLKLETMDTEKSVMTNVPKVYAGLIYGRGKLTETISADTYGRGYMA
ncbi:MAG: flagellar protein FliS [Butyrivibrio sp.]|nr:flagellar protein FliS [Butyrivibrio sp.]